MPHDARLFAILDHMDTALIVVGVVAVILLVVWMFSFMSDPKGIDEEAEAQVRAETPQERERAVFEDKIKEAESNAADIAFYSPGDTDTD